MQLYDERSRSGHAPHVEPLATQCSAIAQVTGIVAAAVVERLEPLIRSAELALAEVLARPGIQAGLSKLATSAQLMHGRVMAVESPGHVPYFKSLGQNEFAARLHTGLVRHFAKRFYEEERDKRIALKAFHNLARRRRWHPALVVQVERLRDHCWNGDVLEGAFAAAQCPEWKPEFMDLLGSIPGGDLRQGSRLLEIAARIAPHMPSARGRPLQFETVLHESFLHWSAASGGRQGYTYGLVDGDDPIVDFRDAATAATRIELSNPSFNPIAARRALKLRFARDPDIRDRSSRKAP